MRKKPMSATLLPESEKVTFAYKDGRLKLSFKKLALHSAVELIRIHG
jgi:hypothetical protein